MTFLIVFLSFLVLILLLLFLNVHLIFYYQEKAVVTLRILFIKIDAIRLFNRLTSDKKEQDQGSASDVKAEETSKKKRKGSILGFADFLARIGKVIALAVKEHFARMKVNLKMLCVEIGTDDAAKTACLYGAAIQAANALCVLLQHFSDFRCNNDHLYIGPNFAADKCKFSIHLDLSTKPIHLIGILIRSYFRFFERKEISYARNTVETSN